MRQFTVFTLLCLGLSAPAWAEGPSFDCAKAATPVEKAICASGDLSVLDARIDDEYRKALKSGEITVSEQRQWLTRRDRACGSEMTVDCLRKFMIERDAMLAALSTVALDQYRELAGGTGEVIVEGLKFTAYFSDLNVRVPGRVEDFNARAKEAGESRIIESCDRVVHIPAGTANHLYGGACVVSQNGKKSRALICADELVGHFHIKDTGNRQITPKDLAIFTARNCSSA